MSASAVLGAAVAARIDPGDPVTVTAALADAGADELRRLDREARHLVADDDVTYRPAGGDHASRWRLDPIPVALGSDEWAAIERGVTQRAELLDLVLSDLYGPRDLVRTGELPVEVVHAHPGFLRPLDGVRLPTRQQLTVCATDLVRGPDGQWVPIGDRTQAPSGAAYALENRSVLARLLPELHRAARVERLAPFLRGLRTALREAAPPGIDEPRIAVLSGGPGTATAFEDGNLAGLLGYPLVEGPDLSVRDGRLWLRSLRGEPARIDVLLRRVDARLCDPLELRADSRRGVAGLVEACRRGGTSVVNHLGAGVLENPGLQAFLPSLCRTLLGQDLRLAPARTLWCGDPADLREVVDGLGEIILRPLARGSTGAIDTATLTAEEQARLRDRVAAHPHLWAGQERIEGPADRCLDPSGRLVDGSVRLRTFVIATGDGRTVLPGGLARAGTPGTDQTWSKDTWVLGSEPDDTEGFWLHRGPRVAADAPESVISARTVESMLWLGRYAERTEATVRLLRTVDDRRGEAAGGTPALADTLDRLLVALTEVTRTSPGFGDAARRADPGTELTALVLDAQRTGTLASSVAHLLEAARAVREQLSGDAWPVLAALERLLLGDDGTAAVLATGARGPAYGRAALAPVLTQLLALQGLGAESLVRDPSWQYLEAGRRLERAQQLVGLLRATVAGLGDDTDGAVTSLVLESVLATCESVVTYRRRYRSRAQLATVLELVLLDEGNPRSLRWQADRLLDVLPDLAPVRTIAATLAAADTDELVGESLADLLAWLDEQLHQAGTDLARTVFVPPPTQRPMVAERAGTPDDELLP